MVIFNKKLKNKVKDLEQRIEELEGKFVEVLEFTSFSKDEKKKLKSKQLLHDYIFGADKKEGVNNGK